mmetsp:Transcript_45470/g.145933  ORF Transcript_45470/g.145933 Transcript_45470/m.145933 type:complete len:229 (-) Transcript_45470:852-1538(-)
MAFFLVGLEVVSQLHARLGDHQLPLHGLFLEHPVDHVNPVLPFHVVFLLRRLRLHRRPRVGLRRFRLLPGICPVGNLSTHPHHLRVELLQLANHAQVALGQRLLHDLGAELYHLFDIFIRFQHMLHELTNVLFRFRGCLHPQPELGLQVRPIQALRELPQVPHPQCRLSMPCKIDLPSPLFRKDLVDDDADLLVDDPLAFRVQSVYGVDEAVHLHDFRAHLSLHPGDF